MSKNFEEIEREFDRNRNVTYKNDNTTIEFMKIERLERIADVLEDINSTLISMSAPIEQLSECVGYAPPRHYQKQGYNFLRIAGQVDTE